MVGYSYRIEIRTIEAALIQRFLCPKKEARVNTGLFRMTQNSLLPHHKEKRQQPAFLRRKQTRILVSLTVVTIMPPNVTILYYQNS